MAKDRLQLENAAWWDFYKLFTYSFEPDPITKRDIRQYVGAGITQPDIPDIRQGGEFGGGNGGAIAGRDTNEMIDMTTIGNRTARYKEYERLLNMAEIDNAMTVFADEACLAGHVPINTPYFGLRPIRWFYENKRNEDFLVYCWDFAKHDYTLGWAFNPRIVGIKKTVRVKFDDGTSTVVTEDHRMLMRDESWRMAGDLKFGDELMAFYRIPADEYANERLIARQFPRVFTHNGWKHERWLLDEWKMGVAEERYEEVGAAIRVLSANVPVRKASKIVGRNWLTIEKRLHDEGFSLQEVRRLGKKSDVRRVVGVEPWKEQEVFDLSVREHENFCGESVVYHNCQKGENKHVMEIEVKNQKVKKELEFLFFHRKMLNVDRKAWEWAKKLFMYGDLFLEMIISPDNPAAQGILQAAQLPPDSMYRIETTKGRLIEFQQSKEGPDYQALTRAPVIDASDADNQQSYAIRFAPKQIVHFRIGDGRKTFYPYGVSLIEAARGPAHQLRLMEDAMVVYRLTRAPERRVFYIDTGQLPPMKADSFMRRVQDLLRKKKVPARGNTVGANAVEERWQAPSADEDFWIPTRQGANTRVETLPGAQNLGEIDDALYFRQKLYVALNFPKNYMNSEDPQATRVSLSANDVKFARFIERLQDHIVDGFLEIAERHLELRGFPEEAYEDLVIKMTAPSDWRELSRAEIITNRINNANSLKGSMLMSTYDILTEWMKYSHEQALRMIARTKMEKIEELKLQIIGQNPQLMGIGMPGDNQGEPEMGAESGGPNPMLAPGGGGMGPPPPGGGMGGPMPPAMAEAPPGGDLGDMGQGGGGQGGPSGQPLPEPEVDDIRKYDLEIIDFDKEADREEKDYSTGR